MSAMGVRKFRSSTNYHSVRKFVVDERGDVRAAVDVQEDVNGASSLLHILDETGWTTRIGKVERESRKSVNYAEL